jgi:hypothetical protein
MDTRSDRSLAITRSSSGACHEPKSDRDSVSSGRNGLPDRVTEPTHFPRYKLAAALLAHKFVSLCDRPAPSAGTQRRASTATVQTLVRPVRPICRTEMGGRDSTVRVRRSLAIALEKRTFRSTATVWRSSSLVIVIGLSPRTETKH